MIRRIIISGFILYTAISVRSRRVSGNGYRFIADVFILYTIVSILSCGARVPVSATHDFTLLQTAETGIGFSNEITESDSNNVFTNEYMYNGSGIGAGDFNNDGLQDLFFCGSMVSSKLYLNKGNCHFEDVTAKAGLQTSEWCTGASIVDINNDGFPDIYVCVSHNSNKEKRKNKLFINDGNMHFTDQAAAYGLADTGYATQAAFFDYDKDGDLDMYLLNHRLYSHTANNLQPKDTSGSSPAQDRLYRNDGVRQGQQHPVFHDITLQAGIKEDGYGLGIVITDVNNDNWPDIYVANDYIGNDLLWLNNGDGTFSNIISSATRHQSYNSMGADAADINNDGLTDLAVADMLPENNERKKMMSSATTQEKFDMQQRFGYQPSYVRNMLQLNNGTRKYDNKIEPFYSEIGQLAGIFETDWSWSVLMTDFDNDGWKDMHITNGLAKDVTNNDYAAFANGEAQTNTYTFGGAAAAASLDKKSIALLRKNIDAYGSVSMNNYLFHNNGDLHFSNITRQAGMSMPSISNGAVYADIDNDGDEDLVVNNMNQPAFVWRNEARKSAADTTKNFITVQFQGPPANTAGIGCRVTLFANHMQQLAEQFPVRGFSSSVDNRIHFGVGNIAVIDSLLVVWPDNKYEQLKNVRANQFITLRYEDAKDGMPHQSITATPIFSDITGEAGIDFTHTETPNFDFGYHQPLLQKYSQLGPCIASGDVNGDGLADFFIGGTANQPGKIFIQQKDGRFTGTSLQTANKPGEDAGAVLFDADGDKDPDLLITGGSFEFSVPQYNQPVLYINDGAGHFSADTGALPAITAITKAVTVADYDGDGDMDIFIGGRLLPQQYPQSPRSYLLQNNKGRFTDVTTTVCPELAYAGMVTGALFTDFDNDKKQDLIICGEWMPIRFFRNNGQSFSDITATTGLTHMNGLWRTLQQSDIDGDGDMDYIAGNTGLNNKYHLAPGHPLSVYAKDIDKNGIVKIIPAYYIKDKNETYQLYPALDRTQLAAEIPSIKKKYLLHKDYSVITMPQLLDDIGNSNWTILQCETAATVWLENKGNGKFTTHTLPIEAQFAPVNSVVAEDIDADGKTDLIVAGNEYQADINTGRYDASYGLLLKGDGKGAFTSIAPAASGFITAGDVKDIKMLSLQNKRKILLVAPNDSKLEAFLLHAPPGK